MTVVSSKEFVTNQEKYFDMALNEHVYIKKGDNMYIFTRKNDEDEYLEPDEDLRRAITMDELLVGALEDIHKFYVNQ